VYHTVAYSRLALYSRDCTEKLLVTRVKSSGLTHRLYVFFGNDVSFSFDLAFKPGFFESSASIHRGPVVVYLAVPEV